MNANTVDKQSSDNNKTSKLFSVLGAFFTTFIFVALFQVTQLLGIYLFSPLIYGKNSLETAQLIMWGAQNGTVLSLAMVLTFIVVFICSYLLIYSRASSTDKASRRRVVFTYLGLKKFDWRVGLIIMGLWLCYLVISQLVLYYNDTDPSAFVDALYDSTSFKWLLILAMVVLVPIYEELIFRGVIWKAWREQISGMGGVWLATILTSLVFAVIHFQYDLLGVSTIFVLALLMSYARYKSGSLWLPIIIHMTNNAMAMALYVIERQWLP